MGARALAQSRSTFPGVSSPWRVVRSMQVTARSSHAACHSFLTVRRFGNVAARRSTALRLMRIERIRSRSSGMPRLRSAAAGGRTALPSGAPLSPGARGRRMRGSSRVTVMLSGECAGRWQKSKAVHSLGAVPPPASRCLVVADAHLGQVPESVVRAFHTFLDTVPQPGDELVVNGDLFDFWFEYGTVVPRRHLPTVMKLAGLVQRGIPVTFLGGNHDRWGGDFLRRDMGIGYYPGAA